MEEVQNGLDYRGKEMYGRRCMKVQWHTPSVWRYTNDPIPICLVYRTLRKGRSTKATLSATISQLRTEDRQGLTAVRIRRKGNGFGMRLQRTSCFIPFLTNVVHYHETKPCNRNSTFWGTTYRSLLFFTSSVCLMRVPDFPL